MKSGERASERNPEKKMKKVTRTPYSPLSFSLSLRLKWAAWGHRGGLREGGRLGHVTARAAAAGGQKGYIYIYRYIYTWKDDVLPCRWARRETHYHGRLCAGRVHIPLGARGWAEGDWYAIWTSVNSDCAVRVYYDRRYSASSPWGEGGRGARVAYVWKKGVRSSFAAWAGWLSAITI